MKSQAENTGGSSPAPARPLHDCACCFISLLKRALTHMPFPIGFFIVTVDRWTHPLTRSLEHHGLCILAAVDDKVLGYIFYTALQGKRILSLLHTQGIVLTSAFLWLKYEEVVKEDIQKAVCLASRIPLISCVISAVCAVSSPSAIVVSDWLSKQAGRQLEKCTDTGTEDTCILVIAKQEVERERLNTEIEAPNAADATSTLDTLVGDVHSGAGEDIGVGDFVKPGKTDAKEDDFVEQGSGKDVGIDDEVLAETLSVQHRSGKDVSVDDEVLEEALSVPDSIIEDSPGNVDVGNGMLAAKQALERHPLSNPKGSHSTPDVLEMIESSWLRGHSSSSPPQSSLTPRPRSNSINKFKTFFFG